MDIMEKFEKHLTKWCKENHKPKPAIDNMNKFWKMAWEDFMKTELTAEWEERKEEYNNIHLLTKREAEKLKQKQSEPEPEDEPEENSWEKIQKFLK